MNKRIKLLADQAEDYATAEYEKWIPTPDFSGIPHIRKIFNEKFAELIVRECAKVAVEHEDYCEMKMIPTYAIDMHILEHFGVEE
jgi:hypothetical protein